MILRLIYFSVKVGEQVWHIVNELSYFENETVGTQIVRAIDSIAANLSEGLGRFHEK
jgi:four helix bundle protein